MNISIDNSLRDIYSSIRLGCLKFEKNVNPSNDSFWKYMDEEVIPEVRESIKDKE